jgi:hypothetical protein
MEAFDLIERYQSLKDSAIQTIKSYRIYSDSHPNFTIGDIIEFYSGYHNDILYRSEIIGFDTDGDIYVLWDCYWSPIRNDNQSRINLINDNRLNNTKNL